MIPTTDMRRAVSPAALEMDAARARFAQAHPDFDLAAVALLRSTEYARLDAQGQVYLDYTGGGLHSASQLAAHMQLLSDRVLGNPHSHNPTSLATTELVEGARAAVLRFFNADPERYLAIFTSNASGALKHVGESYPFAPGGRLLLTVDNHNSVNGIREFARARGASIAYAPLTLPWLRLDLSALDELLGQRSDGTHRLFAFPAQSNFSGVQHPLALIEAAQTQGWDVLLDAAAFTPTNRLDLSVVSPQFVALSFYKMFGYPTGIGCLLVRRDVVGKLRRPWFAGGTISIASVQGDGFVYADGAAAFEDGTVDYLNIPAVAIGLGYLERIGIETIHARVAALTDWLLDALGTLAHSNGRPQAKIHGPQSSDARGGTVTVTLLDPTGESLDERRVEELANHVCISLRTGCFCNPGAGEVAHGLSAAEMAAFFRSNVPLSFDQLRTIIRRDYQKSVASIRVSVGIATTFDDLFRFVRFVEGFRDRSATDVGSHADCVNCGLERQGV